MKVASILPTDTNDVNSITDKLQDIQIKLRELKIKEDGNNIKREQIRSNEKIAKQNKN